MVVVSQWDAVEELIFFMRNSDVLTVSERSVSTRVATGSFSVTALFFIPLHR